jgi:hypothetical protein
MDVDLQIFAASDAPAHRSKIATTQRYLDIIMTKVFS